MASQEDHFTDATNDRSKYVPKTTAKDVYCLTDKDLSPLSSVEKKNPRFKRGAPMRLFEQKLVEEMALEKWGGAEGLEQERQRRIENRQKRAQAAVEAEHAKRARLDPDSAAVAGQEHEGTGQGSPGSSSERHDDTADGLAQPAAGVDRAPGAGAASGEAGASIGTGSQRELSAWVTERIRDCRSARTPRQGQAPPVHSTAQHTPGGEFVLYWMNTALRGHENPALDVARAEARSMGVPLVAAAFLLASHTYPTARRYQFVLEGLRDTQHELRAQGIELLVYLEGSTTHAGDASGDASTSQQPAAPGGQTSQGSPGWRAFMALAGRARLVVTEEMPTPPYHGWLEDLVHQLDSTIPVWAVDTACIIPMRLLGHAYEKAWAFRTAVQKPKKDRLASMPYRDSARDFAPFAASSRAPSGDTPVQQARGSAEAAQHTQTTADAATQEAVQGQHQGDARAHVSAETPAQQGEHSAASAGFVPDGLGWQPLDLCAAGADISAIIRDCSGLDHTVAPAKHVRGGSKAGYERWRSWCLKSLPMYAAKRNNPMLRDGVSRLSAYHHYGMISAFKVARDAIAQRTTGSTKFVDEFLTWRELAYAFCFFRANDIETLKAVPKWAQATLSKHAGDPRSLKSREELEAGRTGDALWDAMQHQLALTGELHNNVRMTWGKAVLLWTPGPEAALKETIHLNHKYALDGCDPCSYGGILWCFGQFDGPRGSESTPIYGSLRMRPTSSISKRLDAAAYRSLPVEQQGSAEREPAQKAISNFFKPRGRKNPKCANADDVK